MSSLFVHDSEDEELQLELSRQLEESNNSEQIAESFEKDKIQGSGILKETKKSSTLTNLHEELDSRVIVDQPLYPLIPNAPLQDVSLKPNIDDIRPVNLILNLPLDFQQKIVENVLISDNPLLIIGKGLGINAIVANLLHVLSTPTVINKQRKRSLVLVLNASIDDNRIISEQLQELNWLAESNYESTNKLSNLAEIIDNERPFNVVTADSLSVEKRRQLYLSGGVVSVTSRILIVDLLSGIVHPDNITGMIVLNSETLKEYSNESFILEIYRSKNKWGFIKAFSESAEAFTMEFSPLMKKMKDLRLKNVLLWPRFRVEISSALNIVKEKEISKVIEVRISPTNSMNQIQFGLVECLKKCIAELNRKNPELARDWWTPEHMLENSFLKSIDSVMMPNWHRISYESKQLIKDIRFLINLTKALLTTDAVDFYEEIQLSLDANKPSVSRKYTESPWLMADESQLVISYAKKRIFNKSEYLLEELPKWEQLKDILEDIEYNKLHRNIQGPTLIMCSNNYISSQLSRLLSYSHKKNGIRKMMMRKLQVYKQRREERLNMVKELKNKEIQSTQLNVSTTFAKEKIVTKRRRTRGAAAVAAVERLRSAGIGESIDEIIDDFDYERETVYEQDDNILFISEENDDELYFLDEDEVSRTKATNITKEIWEERVSEFEYIPTSDEVIIEKFANINDVSFLQEIMPSFIIMYEPDLTFIRKAELYKKINQHNSPQIYFMYYGDSIEEQNYLTSIKREKDAFSKLIRENAMLAHHFEADEDLSHFKNLAERKLKLNRLRRSNTRVAGGQAGLQDYTQDIVIVDSREFNASLPGLLFRFGVRVIPCMLTVGDYIISPDICIERKSISDLIGSLQNNRLISQCKKMSKHYKYPTLLIEFDTNQSFSLEPFSERRNYRNNQLSTTHPISSKLSQDEIQMKISKLVIKFPNLKIIWSSSPLQTVNILLELKLGREQPDPNLSMDIGTRTKSSSKDQSKSSKENDLTRLLQIPGISDIDYFNIKKKVKTFAKLKKLSEAQLAEMLGDVNLAEKINTFLVMENEEFAKDGDLNLFNSI
ncbi:hypothetical protein TBLA_0D02790 [Henningerozyma blattae CBS 6284]|uniref:ERCC4 domain-containing protein n=1 Tax=Henningerozyma blattae (strain ATCC 34711 / CBS 6284 / DSM 70876 / NBRC 10599 / NRRL Y-10934 / UCD 77-7) TaxID=1071380 RepID=I2H328_HENB6|nr:hypothetical protein TBLA_0D02790 [Tetrapisispora blattae CBS 6284]CCH60780.1 hypothetical protein TBLA_0D02790 [Tetrapisispora blattae CBS 6284]